MIISLSLAAFLFGFLTFVFLNNKNLLAVLFFIIFSLTAWKLIKIIRVGRKTGFKDIYAGMSANELVWNKKIKTGGVENGKSEFQVNEESAGSNAENNGGTYGQTGKTVQGNNRESKRADSWSSLVLESSDSIVQEERDEGRRNPKTDS